MKWYWVPIMMTDVAMQIVKTFKCILIATGEASKIKAQANSHFRLSNITDNSQKVQFYTGFLR